MTKRRLETPEEFAANVAKHAARFRVGLRVMSSWGDAGIVAEVSGELVWVDTGTLSLTPYGTEDLNILEG